MNFKNQYANYQASVESAIQCLLPPPETEPKIIHEAMLYALSAGGKRLRPILVLSAADLYPSETIDPIPAAVAVECLHTYSLIHDDLPAMDNSNLRRGRPATHIKYGEAMGILTGDSLLTEAFRLISTAYAGQAEVANQLNLILSSAAGSQRLIGGQVVDTLSEGSQLDAKTLNFIHLNKTAALIQASLKMGLVASDAPQESFAIINSVGRSLGLAFQIIDDILDVTSDSETMGKEVRADVENEKWTYVSAYGIKESKNQARNETQSAIHQLKNLPNDADTRFLTELISQLEHRIN